MDDRKYHKVVAFILGILICLNIANANQDSSKSASIESYDLGFDIRTDGLCFRNGDSVIKEYGPKIFGAIGTNKGICDGMALLVGSLFMNADFDPQSPRPKSSRELRRTLREVSRGFIFERNHRVTIGGYANARELCNSKMNEVIDRAVWLNLRNSIGEALAKVPQMLVRNTNAIGSNDRLRTSLAHTMNGIINRLKAGKPSLLMYYPHVILVVGAQSYFNAAGIRSWALKVYDSNQPDITPYYYVPYSSDGSPSGEQQMFWDVTP